MEVERDVRPNINYLKQIRRLCDKFNTCLIFDSAQLVLEKILVVFI